MGKRAIKKPHLSPTVFFLSFLLFLSSPPPLFPTFSVTKYISVQKRNAWAYTDRVDKRGEHEKKEEGKKMDSERGREEKSGKEESSRGSSNHKEESSHSKGSKGSVGIVKEEVVRKQGEIIVLSPTRISRIVSPKPIEEVITSAPISVEGISEREYLVRFLEPPASRIYEAWIVFQDGSQLLIFIKPAGDSVSEVEILESALEPTPSHPPPVNDYPTLTRKGAVPGTPQTPYLDRIADILKLVVEGKLSEFEENIKNPQDVSPYQELSIIPKKKWDFGERYVIQYLVFNKSGRTIRLREELFYLSSLIRAILLEKRELGPAESTRLLILFDEHAYPEEDIFPSAEENYQGGKGTGVREK